MNEELRAEMASNYYTKLAGQLLHQEKDSSDIVCPFCGETGFDLIGLKDHLNNDCSIYKDTETLYSPFRG